MSRALGPRFVEALAFAAEVHGDQYKKQNPNDPQAARIPYVGHLLGVAALVIEDGGSEDEVIGALLHDTVEDTETTVAELEERFGAVVAHIVDGCTDAYTKPKPPWIERKTSYIDHLRNEADDPVLRVSNADKLYNARTILRDVRQDGDGVFDRFTATKEQSLWYYRTLRDIYLERRPGYLADELDRVVRMIDELVGSEK